MCGIAGLWRSESAGSLFSDVASQAASMARVLAHRGPDEEDVWIDAAHGVAFGHRRLRVIDLSATGHQPMRSASGRFVISFNGEIYNFEEIRSALGSEPRWRGHSDTEVALEAIDAWGLEGACRRFNGMFAFALWDSASRTLSLARDRLGKKPLFVAQLPHGIAFASEVRSFRRLPDFAANIEPAAVEDILRFGCVRDERSIYKNVRALKPGSIEIFDAPRPARRRAHVYWLADAWIREKASARRAELDISAAQPRLHQLLRESVERRMISDVPLGAFLSGGIDSSLVVALMQELSQRTGKGATRTFTMRVEDSQYDESRSARAVAAHLGSIHTELHVSAADALEVAKKLGRIYDEPFADSSAIPTHLISAKARDHVTAALSGDGGDEVFGGYTRHTWGARVWEWNERVPLRVRERIAAGLFFVSPERWQTVLGSRLLRVRRAGEQVHKLARLITAESFDDFYAFLSPFWINPKEVFPDARSESAATGPAQDLSVAEEMMRRDLLGYLRNDILVKVDRASMAVGLEIRSPLLDDRIVEFGWSLPLAAKIHGFRGKWILREILAHYMPRRLFERPKSGFGVPIGHWLRDGLREWAENHLATAKLEALGLRAGVIRAAWHEHLSGRRDWQHPLWAILMLREWHDENR